MTNSNRWTRAILVATGLIGIGAIRVAAADAIDPTACESEIQQVCKGLESQLEVCEQERGQQLSQACRDQLQGAISIAKNGTGPGACVPDITHFCADMNEKDMAQCISDHKAQFSQPCQDYLAGVNATAKQAAAADQ